MRIAKSTYIFMVAALVATASAARAQGVEASCLDPSLVGSNHEGGDACQKVVDLYRYMNIQLGTLVAGGNAVLGQGGTLGGLGHISAELRANAMRASIPDVAAAGVTVGAPRRSEYRVRERWVGVPQVDVSLGLFKGFPAGVTYVGGVDAIVSAAFVPDVNSGSVHITTPDASLKLGYGGRLGIMSETALTPGISVTYLQRDLPRTTIAAAASGSNSIVVQDLEVRTKSWRAVASKSFVVFGLAAGIGQDTYESSSVLTYDVQGFNPERTLGISAEPKRTNMFVDLSITPFPFFRLLGEVGRVSGGDVSTYNTFDPAAADARLYGSLGLRIGR